MLAGGEKSSPFTIAQITTFILTRQKVITCKKKSHFNFTESHHCSHVSQIQWVISEVFESREEEGGVEEKRWKTLTYSLVCIYAGKFHCTIMAPFRIFLIFFVVPTGTISVGESIISKINLEDMSRDMNDAFVLWKSITFLIKPEKNGGLRTLLDLHFIKPNCTSG